MKKILFILLLPLWIFAQSPLDDLIDEVIELNTQSQNQTSSQDLLKLSERKLAIFRKIATTLIQTQPSPSPTLAHTIEALQLTMQNASQVQSPLLLARNTLELNTLLTQKAFEDFVVLIHKRNNALTTQSHIKSIISSTLQKLKDYDHIPTKNLTAKQKEEISSKQAQFEIFVASYVEILSYLNANAKLLIPRSIWSNFNLPSLLNLITNALPESIASLGVAKTLLSLSIFITLFFFRQIIAHLLLKSLGYLSRFLKSQEIQDQIRRHIAKPILMLIIISSFAISLTILAYPKPASPDFLMWVNASYIIALSWLAILLFKGYGIAILGSLAEKNNTFRREVINLLLKITYFLIILIALLILLKNFGFNISALIASLGIGGLAVAFAVKDMLANFFASVVLLFDNSFNQGDWIVCGDIEGTVVEMGLRRTTIRTFDNAMLFVPNSLLANSSVRNWNRRKVGRRIKMQIGVTYSSTPDQIRSCIKDIYQMLLNHPQIAKENDERPPLSHYELDLKQNIVSLDDLLGYKSNLFVVLDEFADSSINILVYCFSTTIKWGEWLDVRQDVMLKIMDIVASHNLSFAFPSQSVYIEEMPKVSLLQS
ncbi:mechanosensitive ion channel family protein [Helicobacter brantae]|uniref:Mechanosensitive ion channel protein n=1 Tax=Helicobacter brantae TaxID=375927 RepID=A0A3D8IZ48_9HELI|nr:mechanosensitive ion channel family protein [Helicobacter brantae]RDU70549.1 mechanosensitive ion channel protein [Helicobacter brantae]